MSAQALADALAAALRRAFGHMSAPIQRVMNAANANERAAKNWWTAKNAPDGVHLLRLYASVPEFASECRRLTARDDELDPTVERDMLRFYQSASAYFERGRR